MRRSIVPRIASALKNIAKKIAWQGSPQKSSLREEILGVAAREDQLVGSE